MTAAKKSAKKKASKAAAKAAKPKVHKMTIKADDTFTPNPLKVKRGELLKIVGPGTKDVDIKVTIDVGGGSGGGGPVVIHS
jgi:ribosomal protein S9